jgi:DNA primase
MHLLFPAFLIVPRYLATLSVLMRIPAEKIEEIRSANDIVDVISQHVRLKKRGKNFVGLCPFHQEKTPSFTVSSEKQVFHCFGCSKGGNVFTFVMEFEKVSFTEAVRSLAEKAGIVISYTEADQEQQNEIESLYNVCRFAGLHFYTNLTKTDEGRSALEYFHQRGFNDETIRTFGLGYSLHSWDGFLNRAKEEGLKREDLQKAGLIRTREDGTDYDYFRGRAMFPIFTTTGRVVGFGARKLRDDDPLGKYINSPETLIYNKSRILFGLFHSKDAIRTEDNSLMVEGYADLISLYQAGIQNVVASSGTALTEEQVQLISRYSKKLTLVYDADSAGSNATIRGMDIALAQDLDVMIVELPEGEDPDSFVKKSGGKEFQKLLDQGVSFIDFKAKQYLKAGAFGTPEGKAQAVRSIVQSIAKMKDELKRNFYIKAVSTKYDIYESVLYRELEQWTEAGSRRDRAMLNPAKLSEAKPNGPAQETASGSGVTEIERNLLRALFKNRDDVTKFIFENVAKDYLTSELSKKLFQMALESFEETGAIQENLILERTDDSSLKDFLVQIVMDRYELGQRMQREKELSEADPMVVAKDTVKSLTIQLIKNVREQKRQELRRLPLGSTEALQLAAETHQLERRLQELTNQPSGT